MYTTLIIAAILFVLKLTSTNKFFHQDKDVLYKKWSMLEMLLIDFDIKDIKGYQEAYLYFIENKNEYDGSTIVQDRWVIRGLEGPSMKHDYDFIVATCLWDYFTSNWRYCVDLRKLNVNWIYVWFFIFTFLTIISPFHYLITHKLTKRKNDKP
jgi:hypothetical protein